MDDPRADFLRRLDAVESRLRAQCELPRSAALTAPDPRSGEQWDEGQVWAHLAEFLPFWIAQARQVVVAWRGEPVRFGRIKSDPERIASIERDRYRDPAELLARIEDGIAGTRDFLRDLPPEAWNTVGRHQTLSDMPLAKIVDEFMIGHLEEHANQLAAMSDRPI